MGESLRHVSEVRLEVRLKIDKIGGIRAKPRHVDAKERHDRVNCRGKLAAGLIRAFIANYFHVLHQLYAKDAGNGIDRADVPSKYDLGHQRGLFAPFFWQGTRQSVHRNRGV